MASAEGTELTPILIKTQGLLAAGNIDYTSQDDLLLLSSWLKVIYSWRPTHTEASPLCPPEFKDHLQPPANHIMLEVLTYFSAFGL